MDLLEADASTPRSSAANVQIRRWAEGRRQQGALKAKRPALVLLMKVGLLMVSSKDLATQVHGAVVSPSLERHGDLSRHCGGYTDRVTLITNSHI